MPSQDGSRVKGMLWLPMPMLVWISTVGSTRSRPPKPGTGVGGISPNEKPTAHTVAGAAWMSNDIVLPVLVGPNDSTRKLAFAVGSVGDVPLSTSLKFGSPSPSMSLNGATTGAYWKW